MYHIKTLWIKSNIFWFSRILNCCQKRSNQGLALMINCAFYIQIIVGISIMEVLPVKWNAYWWATAWPISRFPVFVMGVCAGVICQRIQNGDQDANCSKPILAIIKLNSNS